MKRFTSKMATALVLSTFALQGCATNTDGSSTNLFSDVRMLTANQQLTNEQRALRNRDRDYASARVSGAAVGAVLGGLLCAASGCSAEETVAASGIGAVAGYAGTAYLARENQSFVASQESLQADIAQAREESTAMREDVRLAQAVLEQQRLQTAELQNAYRAGQISQSELDARLNIIRDDIKALQETRANAESRVASLRGTSQAYQRQGFNSSQLDAATEEQRNYLDALRSIEQAMIGNADAASSAVTS